MKNKSLKLGLSYLFRQRLRGKHSGDNVPQLVTPESEAEKAESLIKDILRWADDGGRTLDLGRRTAGSNPDATQERATK